MPALQLRTDEAKVKQILDAKIEELAKALGTDVAKIEAEDKQAREAAEKLNAEKQQKADDKKEEGKEKENVQPKALDPNNSTDEKSENSTANETKEETENATGKPAAEANDTVYYHPVLKYKAAILLAFNAFASKSERSDDDLKAMKKAFIDAENALVSHYRNEGDVAIVDRIKQVLLGFVGLVVGLLASPVLAYSYFSEKQEYYKGFTNTFFGQPNTSTSNAVAAVVGVVANKNEKNEVEVAGRTTPSAKA